MINDRQTRTVVVETRREKKSNLCSGRFTHSPVIGGSSSVGYCSDTCLTFTPLITLLCRIDRASR